MEKGKFTNFKNSYKINKNSYNNNFFTVVIRGKNLGGLSGTLISLQLFNLLITIALGCFIFICVDNNGFQFFDFFLDCKLGLDLKQNEQK